MRRQREPDPLAAASRPAARLESRTAFRRSFTRRFSFSTHEESLGTETQQRQTIGQHTIDCWSWTVDPRSSWLTHWYQIMALALLCELMRQPNPHTGSPSQRPNVAAHADAAIPSLRRRHPALRADTTGAVPIQIALEVPTARSAWLAVDLSVSALFWLDLLLGFRLGFSCSRGEKVGSHERGGELVLAPTAIALRYLRTWFVCDLLGVFPLPHVLDATIGSKSTEDDAPLWRLAYALRLLRLLKLMRVRKALAAWGRSTSIDPNVWRLLRLLCALLVAVHMIACGLSLVVALEEVIDRDSPVLAALAAAPTTATSTASAAIASSASASVSAGSVAAIGDDSGDGIAPLSSGARYVVALYWSAMTMTTVGYGDVAVATTAERLYACFAMLVGAVTFAYMLGNVQHLMANLDTRSAMLRTRMDSISAFLRYREIDSPLQGRVRNYFIFLWSRQAVFDEAGILDELPPYLRRDVALQMHRKIIYRIPFFKDAVGAPSPHPPPPAAAAAGHLPHLPHLHPPARPSAPTSTPAAPTHLAEESAHAGPTARSLPISVRSLSDLCQISATISLPISLAWQRLVRICAHARLRCHRGTLSSQRS